MFANNSIFKYFQLSNKTYLFLIIIAAILNIVGFSYLKLHKRNEEMEETKAISLSDMKSEFKGSVKFNKIKKAAHLYYLKDGRIILIPSGAYNNNYFFSNLLDFLQMNDSIYKPSGNDSLYIYRNNEVYYFILGKVIK